MPVLLWSFLRLFHDSYNEVLACHLLLGLFSSQAISYIATGDNFLGMVWSLPFSNDSFQTASISYFKNKVQATYHIIEEPPKWVPTLYSWTTTLNKIYLLSAYNSVPKNDKFTFPSAFVYFVYSVYKMFPSFQSSVFNRQAQLQYYPFSEAFQNPPGRINHSLFYDTMIFAMYFYDTIAHIQY